MLAKRPDVKPLFYGSKDYEPIDYTKKKFKSPVFLVDPKFTDELKDEEKTCFLDNDFGGWRVPVNPSKWPYVKFEVQDYFKVGPNCACTGSKEIHHKHPQYARLAVSDSYAPVWEPIYENPQHKIVKNGQHYCYQGDDFGGHNIPYPHPRPPTPASFY